jgi:beta-glucosidase
MQLERESIVLLKNDGVLPIKTGARIALIGPQADTSNYGDYVFPGQVAFATTPLDGFDRLANASNVTVTYAQGCERWSNDQSGFEEALAAVNGSDVAVVVVGTWSRDQNELWAGLNATTGEHVDVADLGLVGAQHDLVRAVQATGVPTVVVFISGKPVAEPSIDEDANAVVQQFYPGDGGGIAIAEVLLGLYNPDGKLSISVPRSVGTLPGVFCPFPIAVHFVS